MIILDSRNPAALLVKPPRQAREQESLIEVRENDGVDALHPFTGGAVVLTEQSVDDYRMLWVSSDSLLSGFITCFHGTFSLGHISNAERL